MPVEIVDRRHGRRERRNDGPGERRPVGRPDRGGNARAAPPLCCPPGPDRRQQAAVEPRTEPTPGPTRRTRTPRAGGRGPAAVDAGPSRNDNRDATREEPLCVRAARAGIRPRRFEPQIRGPPRPELGVCGFAAVKGEKTCGCSSVRGG